jgi:hypothetical protein
VTFPVALIAQLVSQGVDEAIARLDCPVASRPCPSVKLDDDGGVTVRLGELRISPEAVARMGRES